MFYNKFIFFLLYYFRLNKVKVKSFINSHKNKIHQGIILKCDPLPYVRISEPDHLLLENKKKGLLWVFLDQITDPQNFGAILRSCFFLVKTILFKKLNSRGLMEF